MPTYYLYRHIRNDINQPFYIGVGKKRDNGTTEKKVYSRAFTTWQRAPEWHSIASTTDFSVDILMESEDRTFLHEKEKEFISLYGRAINGDGPLVNIEPGGICKTLERSSRLKLAKPLYVYNSDGGFLKKYDIGRDAKRELGLNTSLGTIIKSKTSFSGGYFLFYEYQGPQINRKVPTRRRSGRPLVIVNEKNKQEIEAPSVSAASRLLKIPNSTIIHKIASKDQWLGYTFKYK